MRPSAKALALSTLVVALLVQISISGGIRPVLAVSTYVSTPPLTDISSPDSGYPTSTSSGSALTLDFQGTNCGTTTSRYIEAWLKFDISNIPPQATIVSATISASLSVATVSATVGAYYEPDSNWNQATLDWNNMPSTSGAQLYSSTFVSNSAGSYQWDVTQALVANLPTQPKITFILFPTSSQSTNCNGWIIFTSSSIALRVTYSYASASVSLSNNSIQYGNFATITGNTDPPQSGGTMTLQYSTDQNNWINIVSQFGGSYSYSWQPPSSGTFYIRAFWSISWSGGSYSTPYAYSSLVVTLAPASIQLSLSSSSVFPGQSVAITVNISPQVSDGTVNIQYSKDGVNWIQVTSGIPNSGAFTYTWSPGQVGTFYLRAIWSGDNNYASATSSQATLTVRRYPTAISLNAPTSARLDDTVPITATLRDNGGSPIAGATLTFELDSAQIGTGVTSSLGTATLTYKLSIIAGYHVVSASYAGSDQYLSATAQSGLTVSPWKLVITTTVPQASLIDFNNRNYTTDISGQVVVLVNFTAPYHLSVNSPLTISAGTRAIFLNWGDGSISKFKTINVDSDISISVVTKFQYLLALVSSYGKPSGTAWYDSGSNAQYSVESIVDQGNGTRRVFAGWEENGRTFAKTSNGSIQMSGPLTLSAVWKKQFSFEIVSQYGNPNGGDWYDAGSKVTASVQSPFSITRGTRYVVIGFAGTGAAPASGNATDVSFTLTAPSVLTFHWKTEHLISIANGGGNVSTGGWYDEGTQVMITAISPSNVIQNTSRLIFLRWAGTINSSSTQVQLTAGEPSNLTAVWKKQYYVQAASKMGQVTGGQLWYDEGSNATIQVSPTSFGFVIQQVFDGWGRGLKSGDGTATFVVDGPKNLHAMWRTDYTQLIILVAIIIAGAGLGAFVRMRKKKPASMEEPVVASQEEATTVTQGSQPETGTSVYRSFPCPSCGTENPAGAVFCANCGADLGSQKN